MRRVAITGVSGYIGSQLLARLEVHPDVEAIIGIDNRPHLRQSGKLRFFLRDVTHPLDDLFDREGIDSAVHLAFVVRPVRDRDDARKISIQGTQNFLQACLLTGVEHVLYLGSTTAYGAHADNPVPLTEESPLRPNEAFRYAKDKAETDGVIQSFALAAPEKAVTILRGCVVLGPGGARSIGGKMFQPVMIRVAGHDPLVQYVHEEDLIELLTVALERRPPGVFNVAGDGLMVYSDVAKLAHRRMAAIPKTLLGGLIDLTWALRLQSESTSSGLDFIAYPWVATNGRFKAETGFDYRYSSRDAVQAYVKTLG